ncbi:hypothetical protein T484DRAFT_1821926, partial [Baffinella frigidus]
ATLDGRTDATGSTTTEISVAKFPAVSSSSEVALSFGTIDCATSPDCYIVSVSSSASSTRFQVRVPPSAAVGSVFVTLAFIGQEPLPKGGDPDETYVRERKELATLFTYFSPAPIVRSVGMDNTLIVVIDNGPKLPFSQSTGAIQSPARAIFTFGRLLGTVTGVASSTAVSTTYHVKLPEFSEAGLVSASVSIKKDASAQVWEADFELTIIDDRFSLRCQVCV